MKFGQKENAKENEQSEDFEGGSLQEINTVQGKLNLQLLDKQSLKSLENCVRNRKRYTYSALDMLYGLFC